MLYEVITLNQVVIPCRQGKQAHTCNLFVLDNVTQPPPAAGPGLGEVGCNGVIGPIVKSLNQFSRDSQTINEECNIHTVLDNCLTMLHNQLKHKVKIINNYSAQKAVLQGNVGNLHQVFRNNFV